MFCVSNYGDGGYAVQINDGVSILYTSPPFNIRQGCTDVAALNFDVDANFNDGSCLYDTTPPDVTITAPSNGGTVSGSSVIISATSSDDIAVTGLQFSIDGTLIGTSGTSSPYSVTWNSTTTPDGPHDISAAAHDAAGNYSTSTISITVSNHPATGRGTLYNNGTTLNPATVSNIVYINGVPKIVNSAPPSATTGTRATTTASTTENVNAAVSAENCPAGFICIKNPDGISAAAGASSFKFLKNLMYTDEGFDVLKLQQFLQSKMFLGAKPNGYFGPATRAALIKFQKANTIKPSIGFFGPITRRVVNGMI